MPNDLELDNVLLRFLKPEERLDVNEWADKHRMLSQKASAEPGRYRSSRTPYLIAMMQDLSTSSPVETIVVKKGAQVGFTEVGNNWIGYIIDHAPSPTMIVMPNDDLAKKNSKTRIQPLIEESPRLNKKVSKKKSRDSSNTILTKDFEGGVLVMVGANSASSLRSTPIRNLFLDEVDAYKKDVGGEGSPIKLARARTRTFAKRKILLGSTPTVEGQSHIDVEFEKTDQRYFFVPCTSCEFMQVIEWEQITWQNDDPSTARFKCIECGHLMADHEKTKLLDNGEWRPTRPEKENRKVKGYHVSSLYSPAGWYSWQEAVSDFIDAQKSDDIEDMKSFVNTVLGISWQEKVEVPDWKRIYERREAYQKNVFPAKAVLLTAGVDVQQDRIELEIVAWGKDKVSWSIDYRV